MKDMITYRELIDQNRFGKGYIQAKVIKGDVLYYKPDSYNPNWVLKDGSSNISVSIKVGIQDTLFNFSDVLDIQYSKEFDDEAKEYLVKFFENVKETAKLDF